MSLPMIWKVKLVGKKKFVAATLNPDDEAFVIHIASIASPDLFSSDLVSSDLANSNLASLDPVMYPFHQAHIVSLKADETFIAILSEYSDIVNVFSLDLIEKLLEYIRINDHVIRLIDGK